ncbi:MAG: type 4a pilus biogenesis protein PilO [Elusimicrobia bacterium]|nr:type 4a pilus biogenesis protein PilO [Elusimicrobiota bacterium]
MDKIKLSKEQIQQIAAAVMMAALGSFVYFKYFLKPNLESIKKNKVKVVELTKRVEDLEKRAKKRERLLAEIAEAESAWTALRAKLPDTQNMPNILQVITQMARKHRVQVSNINPMSASSAGLYDEIPFGLSITGSYHDVALFMETMGKMERIFHTRNLSLSRASPTTEAPWISVSVSLTLVTYQYKGG